MSSNKKSIIAVLGAALITGGIILNAKLMSFVLFFFMLSFVIRWIMTSSKEDTY